MFRLRRFRVGRPAAALIAPALLAGCMSVNVPEAAFFYPNARVSAEKIELPTDRPMAFPTDTLNVAYAGGPVGVTRVRTGRAEAFNAAAPGFLDISPKEVEEFRRGTADEAASATLPARP